MKKVLHFLPLLGGVIVFLCLSTTLTWTQIQNRDWEQPCRIVLRSLSNQWLLAKISRYHSAYYPTWSLGSHAGQFGVRVYAYIPRRLPDDLTEKVAWSMEGEDDLIHPERKIIPQIDRISNIAVSADEMWNAWIGVLTPWEVARKRKAKNALYQRVYILDSEISQIHSFETPLIDQSLDNEFSPHEERLRLFFTERNHLVTWNRHGVHIFDPRTRADSLFSLNHSWGNLYTGSYRDALMAITFDGEILIWNLRTNKWMIKNEMPIEKYGGQKLGFASVLNIADVSILVVETNHRLLAFKFPSLEPLGDLKKWIQSRDLQNSGVFDEAPIDLNPHTGVLISTDLERDREISIVNLREALP